MFDRRSWRQATVVVFLLSFGAAALGQPVLSRVQDKLYKADGTPFKGIALIEWKSFVAGNTTTIAEHSTTAFIVDGVLSVELTPTTDASPVSYYSVTYNSDGRVQFREYWAVSPSSVPLLLKDVRIPSPPVSGGSGSGRFQISDIFLLQSELAARPVKSPAFTPGRALVANAQGQLETVTGNVVDCVKVDGSSGSCGKGQPGFADAETPAGPINGSNLAFTLLNAPSPVESLMLHRNGLLQKQGLDYTVNGSALTFAAASIPQAGDTLLAYYRWGDEEDARAPRMLQPSVSTLTAVVVAPVAAKASATATPVPAVVICSAAGDRTESSPPARLGACTIPAGLLKFGDRLEARFDYVLTGSAAGFSIEVRWGDERVLARSLEKGETLLTGRADLVVYDSGTQWSLQSWGAASPLAASMVQIGGKIGATPLTLSFFGQTKAGANVTLRGYTLLRYPAVMNP